jgi:hypothetical protein
MSTRLPAHRSPATTTTAALVVGAALLGVAPGPVLAADPAPFLSEYVEGSGSNRALEIYNPTAVPINLTASRYFVLIYPDGSTGVPPEPLIGIPLTGELGAGQTYVVAHADADATIPAQLRTSDLVFDGNDHIRLVSLLTAQVIDSIGRVGEDPGNGWGTGSTSTADNTLRRRGTVVSGDTQPNDSFDPSDEWEGVGLDRFEGLGFYPDPSAPPDPSDPPTTGFDGLRELASGAHPAKTPILTDRIDRAERFSDTGQADAADAQLRALANQARGFAPRFLPQAAADELAAAAEALAAAD